MLCGLWDLSSPTRDQTQALAVKVPSPNHWTTREFSKLLLSNFKMHSLVLLFLQIFIYFIIYFFRLLWVLVAACRLLVVACRWDLAPRPEMEPGPPTLEAQRLTHWTTREVPLVF